jgi:hypothetical protein
MNVKLLAASALKVQSLLSTFLQLSDVKQPMSTVHKRAAKKIMSSILPLKRSTDYLNQGRTGSQYGKNAAADTIKPTQTRIYRKKICKWLCDFGATSISIYLCYQKSQFSL